MMMTFRKHNTSVYWYCICLAINCTEYSIEDIEPVDKDHKPNPVSAEAEISPEASFVVDRLDAGSDSRIRDIRPTVDTAHICRAPNFDKNVSKLFPNIRYE